MRPSILTPTWLAMAQLDDPALLGAVLRSVGLAVLGMAGMFRRGSPPSVARL